MEDILSYAISWSHWDADGSGRWNLSPTVSRCRLLRASSYVHVAELLLDLLRLGCFEAWEAAGVLFNTLAPRRLSCLAHTLLVKDTRAWWPSALWWFWKVSFLSPIDFLYLNPLDGRLHAVIILSTKNECRASRSHSFVLLSLARYLMVSLPAWRSRLLLLLSEDALEKRLVRLVLWVLYRFKLCHSFLDR